MANDFAQQIAMLAAAFDLSVTSWWRSHKRNKAVGGKDDSRHLVGLAVDIVLDEGQDAVAFVKLAVALGLEVLAEGDHYHVQAPRQLGRVLTG